MINLKPANEEETKALYAELGEGLEGGWILCTGVIPKAPKASSKDSPKEPPQNTPNFSRESLREMLMETARRVRLEPRSEEEYQQAKLREFRMFEKALSKTCPFLDQIKAASEKTEPGTNANPKKDE